MDCNPPGSSIHGIFQARILEWVAISSSRRSSPPRDWIQASCIPCISRWILYHYITWETQLLDYLLRVKDFTSLPRNLYAGQEATELDMEQQTGSKLGKEYIKAVYCHPAYLTCMQNTSCEKPGWMKHKLESRFPGEISVTSDMQMAPALWQKVRRN